MYSYIANDFSSTRIQLTYMAVKITYFVHGTTTDNEADLATGWQEGVLSEIGVEQTIKLGQQIDSSVSDTVFCSDLKRAVDSAKLIFGNKQRLAQNEILATRLGV